MFKRTCLIRLCCAAIAAVGFCSATLAQTGACCTGTTCVATTTGCTGTTVFISAGTCAPNSCTLVGACCSGATCAATTTGCTTNGAFILNGSCTPTVVCTGACCSSGGACTLAASGSCTGANAYLGNGVACTPTTICSATFGGACCNTATGACTTGVMPNGCSGVSTFLGTGSTCGAGACTGALGICCATNGACTLIAATACTQPSTFTPGTSCSPNPCTIPTGACCVSDGATCSVRPAAGSGVSGACGTSVASLSALVGASGVVTATVSSTPYPLSSGMVVTIAGATPTGYNGTFVITVTDSTHFTYANTTTAAPTGTLTATLLAETYMGDNTTCPTSPCSTLVGACCATAGACSTKTISGCAVGTNQTFQGVGSTCGSAPCLTGACCSPTGVCTLAVASACGLTVTNFGTSSFLGNGSTCTANVCFTTLGSGACCPNGTAACALTIPSGCLAASFATYQGNSTTCSPTDPCTPLKGACCATGGTCSSTVALACFGLFRGAGTACTASPCADVAGACCNPVGGCFIAQNAGGNGCTGNNSFRGAGSACTPQPCAALLGACCSGIGACTVTILSGCTNPNTFVASSTSCTATPCNPLKGACCSGVGTCTIAIASGCTGASTFSGVGTACTPNNCIPNSGACCNVDTGACTQTSAAGCSGANVVWGSGVSCNPGNPCSPQPNGACCLGTNCFADQEAGPCLSIGGFFFFGQGCGPNPCVRPLVDISQIFANGGEAGSPYKYDYVELFNRGASPVVMNNWSIQYGSQSTQTFPQRATFSGTIQPGHYFLIQLASRNLAVGTDLPVPADVVSNSNLKFDITGGRVALVSNSNSLPNGCPQPIPVNIVDFVGYGPPSGTGAPSCSESNSPTGSRGGNIYAFFRKANGCQDTDNNGQDFNTQPQLPDPRNSSSSYICGSTTTGACCTGEVCAIATAGTCGTVAGFMGEGTTCTPNNPCLLARGSCCNGTACTFVLTGECVLPSVYTFGRACSPDPCSGACCNGTSCAFTSQAACAFPAYFTAGVPCSPNPCPGPVAVESGDIAYGASVFQNQDAIQQIRGVGSASPVRAGTWTRYNSLQIVRFDNKDAVLHNASGNLLAMDFGTTSAGGAIYNMPTNGDATAGSQLFAFTGATSPYNLTRSRLGGMSVSPFNNRIACIGYDFARLYVLSYNPGAAPGTGAGASIDGAASTDNNSFVFGFNITQGTAWLNNDTVIMWVLSDIASVLKVYAVPVSGTGNSMTLGTPVEKLAVQDNKPNSSRFTSIAYNPQLVPNYLFLGASAFQSISLNSLYIVDVSQPTWTVVKTIDLSGSLQTERELAVGPDRNLYLCQFAGAGQTASDPLIDKIILDANGDGVVTAGEIDQLGDNCSVDFYLKGQANTSSFNAIDIAVRLGACCSGTTCSIQPPNFCNGANGVYLGNDTACFPGNPCTLPLGVCCRGATCTTAITSAANCTGSLVAGQRAGASFPTSADCNAAGNSASPCCYANYNKVGPVNVLDIFDFLSDWFAGSPFARVGTNGAAGPVTVQHIFDFLSAWFAGGCS